jgi:holin-like protein
MLAERQDGERSKLAGRTGTSVVRDLVVILGIQLVGEMVQRITGIAIAGPVLGLVFLVILLILRGGPWGTLPTSARGLLHYLPLLFVPAGAGVAAHFELIRAEWMPIVASMVGSSIVTILVTAWTMRAIDRWQARRAVPPWLRPTSTEAEHRQ